MFWPHRNDEFIKLRDAIDTRRRELRTTETSADNLVALEKLAELHKSGILTDDEFAAKKKQLMGL